MNQRKIFDVSACLLDGGQISLGLFDDAVDAQDYARALNKPAAAEYRRLLGITRFRIQPRTVTPRKQDGLIHDYRCTACGGNSYDPGVCHACTAKAHANQKRPDSG